MENVRTGVLDKNKEHYLKSKDKAEKSYDVLSHIKLHVSQYKKNEDLQSIMSNLQPNCCLKVDFQKRGQTCRSQVVNPRHQTPQGQSLAKPETPLQNIQVE